MDETKYVCEPHYDENGVFDYWNPLFPYRLKEPCNGCVKENDTKCGEWCEMCSRSHPDLYIYAIGVD